MSVQDDRRPGDPVAPDPELLRAALRATEARIARSSIPGHEHSAAPHPPGHATSFHSADEVAAVEHRVDHLAASFGEAMQAHARFRSWVTAAVEDLSQRVLESAPAGHEPDTDVRRRLDELDARLDAFDEQAARMVTYLTGLADELQHRMDRIESRLSGPTAASPAPAPSPPPAAATASPAPAPTAPAPTAPAPVAAPGVPRITLRPILPPDPPRR